MPFASSELERPLVALLLLPVCLVVVWLAWRFSRAYLPRTRRLLLLGLRLASVGLVLLSLANPIVQLKADDLAIAVLLDRSDSISPSARADQEQWLAQLLAHKRPQDQVTVVTFAGNATVQRELSADPTPPQLDAGHPDLQPSSTDLSAALRTGLAALPPNMARRIVLLSDGVQNQGD